MRRLVAALVLATISFSIISCGGGGESAAVVTPSVTAGGEEEAAPLEDTLSPTETISPEQKQYPEPWKFTKSQTPKVIQKRLDAHQPMMIVYIDTKQSTTKDEKAEISAATDEYEELIDVIYFDITKGLEKSKAKPDPDTEKALALAKDLRISFTPYILFIDQFGRITWRFSGYTDRKLLEREILRATK